MNEQTIPSNYSIIRNARLRQTKQCYIGECLDFIGIDKMLVGVHDVLTQVREIYNKFPF